MGRTAAKAFTLVELMVVVAIIALLVSMLMPTLQRGVEMARRATCRSNCREIARACTLYSMEARVQRSGPPRTLPSAGPTSSNWHTGPNANRESMRLLVVYGFLSPESLACPSIEGNVDTFYDKSGTNPLDGGRCGYSFLSMVDRSLVADDVSAAAVLVADRNPRFGPNSKSLLNISVHANSVVHGVIDGEGEGQNIARRDESAEWVPTTKLNTGPRADDYIYESDSPSSDSSGKASGPGDVILLN